LIHERISINQVLQMLVQLLLHLPQVGSLAAPGLEAATDWAHARINDGPHVVSAPIITMQAPYRFEPEQSGGRDERRVGRPEKATVRMPAGAPLLRLA
jgi:hypothetical protein